MAEIVLFRHAQGLTPGIRDFAGALTRAGHTVHLPDLYEGRIFDTLDDGVGYAREAGFDRILDRGRHAAEALPAEVVYAGISLGVMPAQLLAQTRPGATGALLVDACLPVEEFSPTWPAAVPVQVHGMDVDPFFAVEGDLDAARALIASAPQAELFLYPGDRHLFADNSLDSYVPAAAELLTERVLTFLEPIK
jgi:dienelactone hydrolase